MNSNFTPGDHIRVCFGLYWHHGIYVSDSRVIHRERIGHCVRCVTLEEFLAGQSAKAEKVVTSRALPRAQIVARAENSIGDLGYDVVFNNCEHFATWCQTGMHCSTQANCVMTVGLGLGLLLVIGSSVRRTNNA